MTLTMVPAYGRDYNSKRAVEKALKHHADFRVQDVGSKWDGMVGNLHDLQTEGHKDVRVRYSKLRKICIIELEAL